MVVTTVVVVDDHLGFRQMARRMLEDGGFDVVGEAEDGESALTRIADLAPAMVLLDIHLPDIDGFTVARRLADAKSPTVVVLTSSRIAPDYGARLAQSPAAGFIAKDELSASALAELLGSA